MSVTVKVFNASNKSILLNTKSKVMDISHVDPSELIAGGLAKCTKYEIQKFIEKKRLEIKEVKVVVKLTRDNSIKTSYFVVNLEVGKNLTEVEERQLLKAARNSYINRLLTTKIVLEQNITFRQ